MNFTGKRVLVIGAARSGLSAARLLNGLGACVTLSDSKRRELFKAEAEQIESIGVRVCTGGNADYGLIKEQELIIASPGVPSDIEPFVIANKLKIPVIGEMELAFLMCQCPIAAITGTNGKTTTTALAGEIIGRYNKGTIVAGNIGKPFSECVNKLGKSGFAVIEASSFQLESIKAFKPDISAILNITPDHLDRHKTLKRYIEAKTNIYKNTGKGCHVLLNKGDAVLSRLKIDTGAEVLYFSAVEGVENGACLKNGYIMLCRNGKETRLINKEELQIPGAHNIENALAAALIASCAGVPDSEIQKGLAAFKGVPHRMELVRELNGVRFYNDSKATNPDASIKAINAVRDKIVLIAGGYDKGADYSELVALFSGKLSYLIALGETKEKLIEQCKKAGFTKYAVVDGYEEAVSLAYNKAVPGETVLLSPACASWDMFSDFEERGDYYKQLINKL